MTHTKPTSATPLAPVALGQRSPTPVALGQLHADRRALEARILNLKRGLRSTWHRPMAPEQRELLACQAQVTDVYILRAWLRGRSHLRDELYCDVVARRVLPDYAMPSAAREVPIDAVG